MFHLINKVYLAADDNINIDKDRVVISENNGVPLASELEQFHTGKLFKVGRDIEEVIGDDPVAFFDEIIKFSKTQDKKLVIYADMVNLLKVQILWYKLIFSSPTKEACERLFKTNLFSYNQLHRNTLFSKFGQELLLDNFEETYENLVNIDPAKREVFIKEYTPKLSVEYLLANYVYDGSFKDELKSSIKLLMAKSMDKLINEYKGLYYMFHTNSIVTANWGLDEPYDFENFGLLEDTSPMSELFTSSRVFKSLGLTNGSTDASVNFEAITDDDLVLFEKMASNLGPIFKVNTRKTMERVDGELLLNTDGYKWRYLDIVRGEFTDDLLLDLLDNETTIDHAHGMFYDSRLITVNGFFVQYILQCRKNKTLDKLKPYILKG